MVWAHEHSYERLYPVYNRKVNFHFSVCLFVYFKITDDVNCGSRKSGKQVAGERVTDFFSRYLSIFCDPELNRHITKLFLGNFYCITAAHPP